MNGERHYYAGMFKLQTTQLFDNEEQEEADGSGGVQEVLSLVQQTHTAQGNQVKGSPFFGSHVSSSIGRVAVSPPASGGRYVSSSIGRAAVSKTAGWGFESLLTCERATGEHVGGQEILRRLLVKSPLTCTVSELETMTDHRKYS